MERKGCSEKVYKTPLSLLRLRVEEVVRVRRP